VAAAVFAGLAVGIAVGSASGPPRAPVAAPPRVEPAVDRPVKPGGPTDPMPPDQRDAYDAALAADYDKKYQAWLRSDFVKSQDLRSLPQYPLLGEPVPGYDSLEEASDHAGMAVLGQVVSVNTGEQTETTFRVERTAKGTASSTISFVQSGGIRPEPDFDHAVMAVSEAAPMLFSGDRAVLLLEPVERNGHWRIQNFSGEYRSDPAGKVHSVRDNDFHDVDGMSESQLMDRIEMHLRNEQQGSVRAEATPRWSAIALSDSRVRRGTGPRRGRRGGMTIGRPAVSAGAGVGVTHPGQPLRPLLQR
jgi:hypothetical protein